MQADHPVRRLRNRQQRNDHRLWCSSQGLVGAFYGGWMGIKKYSRAVNSSVLTDDSRHHNTDILAAFALSGCDIGTLLIRAKYAGDRKAVVESYHLWRECLIDTAMRRRFLAVKDEVADISLTHWLDDGCPVCHGVKLQKIVGTPMLDTIVCPECSGLGTKQLNCESSIRELVFDCIQTLNIAVSVAAAGAKLKLDSLHPWDRL